VHFLSPLKLFWKVFCWKKVGIIPPQVGESKIAILSHATPHAPAVFCCILSHTFWHSARNCKQQRERERKEEKYLLNLLALASKKCAVFLWPCATLLSKLYIIINLHISLLFTKHSTTLCSSANTCLLLVLKDLGMIPIKSAPLWYGGHHSSFLQILPFSHHFIRSYYIIVHVIALSRVPLYHIPSIPCISFI
jgi:hypothetical protein